MPDANQHSNSNWFRPILPPLWWIAFFVLIVNDHYLKFNGLVPDWITGKASDFAGLFVAPVVAAALLRVTSRSKWVLCHIAIGLLFTFLQLSPSFAELYESCFQFIHIPSQVTCDPSDLLALPVLFLSYRYCNYSQKSSDEVKTIQVYRPPTSTLVFQKIGLVCGVLASLGSSQVSNDIPDENLQPLNGSVFLHNNSDADIILFTRSLDSQRFVDCLAVGQSPGLLLRESNFSEPLQWNLSARATIPLSDSTFDRPCHAILVESDQLSPVIVFWWRDAYPSKEVPTTSAAQEALERGVLSIEFNEQGNHTGYRHDFGILHYSILPIQPQTDQNCIPADEASRLDWSELPTFKHVEIQSVATSPDGCVVAELLESGIATIPQSPTYRWHLCIPPMPFPFADGDRLEIQPLNVSGADVPGNVDGLLLRKLEGSRVSAKNSIDTMILSRGDGIPAFEDLRFERFALPHCGYSIDATCGTAIRSQWLRVSPTDQASLTLTPNTGHQSLVTSSGRSVSIYLTLGHERAVADQNCLSSKSNNAHDFELVATLGVAQQ